MKVVVIGMGYIGLPTAALISQNKIEVLGVDINQNVVDTINSGEIHINEPSLYNAVKKSVSNNFLSADTKPNYGDVFVIVVPTPFDSNHNPDLTFVKSAIKEISIYLKESNLVIIESTSPVGTTEEMLRYIYKIRPDLKNKIKMAYCPERVLPGNIMYELVNNDRVIGGIDSASNDLAIDFYSKFVAGQLHTTDSKTAEMCKLVENASRDNQIAFANELSMICYDEKIDAHELISLANKHPRVNILNPSPGVGGHCIAVDPYFIISRNPKNSNLIQKSREVNLSKTEWCIKLILESINKFTSKYGINPKIGLYGLSYKADVDDLRESPSVYITKKILDYYGNKNTYVIEPNISNYDGVNLSKLNEAYSCCDIHFLLVNHKEFKTLNWRIKNIIDFCGVNDR